MLNAVQNSHFAYGHLQFCNIKNLFNYYKSYKYIYINVYNFNKSQK